MKSQGHMKLLLGLMVILILGCSEKNKTVTTKADYRLDYVTIFDQGGQAYIKVSGNMRSKISKKVIHELNLIGERELSLNAKNNERENIPSMAGPTIIGLELMNLDQNVRVLSRIHMDESGKIFLTSSISPDSLRHVERYLGELMREHPRKRPVEKTHSETSPSPNEAEYLPASELPLLPPSKS